MTALTCQTGFSVWHHSGTTLNFNSCKKHLSMELKCVFQHIVNQLKKGLGTELVVLEEHIQQMANVQYTHSAMAGSETLQLQSLLFGSTRNYKVSRGIKAPFLYFMISWNLISCNKL
ncbi:hypothetical protein VPH35_133493 [Triticum aestivum]